MYSDTSSWPGLITLVSKPLEDVVESAELFDEWGINLTKELVHVLNEGMTVFDFYLLRI